MNARIENVNKRSGKAFSRPLMALAIAVSLMGVGSVPASAATSTYSPITIAEVSGSVGSLEGMDADAPSSPVKVAEVDGSIGSLEGEAPISGSDKASSMGESNEAEVSSGESKSDSVASPELATGGDAVEVPSITEPVAPTEDEEVTTPRIPKPVGVGPSTSIEVNSYTCTYNEVKKVVTALADCEVFFQEQEHK